LVSGAQQLLFKLKIWRRRYGLTRPWSSSDSASNETDDQSYKGFPEQGRRPAHRGCVPQPTAVVPSRPTLVAYSNIANIRDNATSFFPASPLGHNDQDRVSTFGGLIG